MKTLIKLALVTVLFITTVVARPQVVSGHFRSSGTYVTPFDRPPTNGIPCHNLSHRGYPSQQPGCNSLDANLCDSDWSRPKTMPSCGNIQFHSRVRPKTGSYSPKILDGRVRSPRFGS